jgi:hypothetical protein
VERVIVLWTFMKTIVAKRYIFVFIEYFTRKKPVNRGT